MTINKPLLIAGVATTLAIASVAGASAANSSTTNPQDNLINKIAKKFNLKPADVKAVFEQDRSEHEAAMNQKVEDKLNQLVKDGKLTEQQKTAILAKRDEIKKDMQANRDSMKDKTPAERKALMDQKKSELDQWAKDNNIPTEYLHFVFGHGPGGRGPGGHGMGGPRHMDGDNDENEANQSSANTDSATLTN